MGHFDSLVRDLEVVRISDPALAMDLAARKKYGETRDPRLIRELPGQTAIRFKLRALTGLDADAIERVPSGGNQIAMAFRFACFEVVNCSMRGPSPGESIVPTLDLGSGRKIFNDEEYNVLHALLGRRTIHEIGGIAYERLLEGKEAGGSVPFTVPQSSLAEAERVERQRAAHQSSEPAAT